MVVTVTCTITDIADPTPPATQTYYIYDPTMSIDLSYIVYTQTPPCEHPATNSFSWVIPADGYNSITEASDTELTVVSNDKTHYGTFSVIL